MRQTLFGFIWAYSARQQITILAITCLSFPLVYAILEVPKQIINSAIEGHRFPEPFLGFELEQIPYLLALSGLFMTLIVANNAVKFVLNLYKGIVGERMLRRLRYQLYEAVLRFRPRAFRKVSGDTLIPMITSEVEDLGHFVSEAVATPAFQGGSLVVYIAFIFVQNVWLGLVAIALYPLQAWLIPHLQRQVSLLARDRVRNLRVIADRVGSAVAGAESLHSDGTRAYHLADFSDRLHENYRIRLDIYKKKYLIKFLNNFMNQMPPFVFYAVGGYFVIIGDLSIGALVASIAAYQDIAGPWKDLLGYYQRYAMSAIKYTTIIENFEPEDRFSDERLAEAAVPVGQDRDGEGLRLQQVALAGGSGADLSEVSFELSAGGSLAIAGSEESGRGSLLQAIAGLVPLTSGRILLGGRSLAAMTEAELAQLVAYVGPEPYLFDGSLRSNLAYPLKRHQLGEASLPADEARFRRREALLSGNAAAEFLAPWTDFAHAGVADSKALDKRMVALLSALGMGEDLVHFGLARVADPGKATDFVGRALQARAAIATEIAGDSELASLVDLWEPDRFNESGSLLSNILFGFPKQPDLDMSEIARDPDLMAVLEEADLHDPLIALGAEASSSMIRLYLDAGDDGQLLCDKSPVGLDQLEEMRPAVECFESVGQAALDKAQGRGFLALALQLEPGRHPLPYLTGALRQRILAARQAIQGERPRFEARYAFFEPEGYIASLDIEHNLLQGRMREDRSAARQKIGALVRRIVEREGLTERIQRYGLDHPVGVGGSALSGHQRRRVALARALIKRPALLLADLGQAVDGDGIAALASMQDGMLLIGVALPEQASACDSLLSLVDGRLVGEGRAEDPQ